MGKKKESKNQARKQKEMRSRSGVSTVGLAFSVSSFLHRCDHSIVTGNSSKGRQKQREDEKNVLALGSAEKTQVRATAKGFSEHWQAFLRYVSHSTIDGPWGSG